MGPYPTEDQVDARLINAGKQTVTALPGASMFDSALSFAMIRGGHIDLAILGGLEVACNGDLANWTVPGKLITGMGGAMDLAAGARRVVVLQSHVSKDGKPKLVAQLTLPRDRARLREPRDHRARRVRHRRRLLHLRRARRRRRTSRRSSARPARPSCSRRSPPGAASRSRAAGAVCDYCLSGSRTPRCARKRLSLGAMSPRAISDTARCTRLQLAKSSRMRSGRGCRVLFHRNGPPRAASDARHPGLWQRRGRRDVGGNRGGCHPRSADRSSADRRPQGRGGASGS